jgi:hypothetical protein
MTLEEHITRHKKLHNALDELLADWIENSGLEQPYPSKHTILELVEWSHQQTINPTPDKYEQQKEQT